MKAPTDRNMPYPRICAHRGYNFISPENTLPAFALAVSMGAEELEFDLWPSKDGDLIVCHDPHVERTTGGACKGLITEMTTKEIRALDAGGWYSPAFQGVKFPFFSEVLELCGGKTIMNIHIKSPRNAFERPPIMKARGKDLTYRHANSIALFPPLPEGIEEVSPEMEVRPLIPYDQQVFGRILDTLDQYSCRSHAYITGEKDVLFTAREMAPDMPRCCLEGHMNFTIVEHALEYGCTRVQFCKGLTTQRMIDNAHRHGLTCNLFWADTAEEARAYLDIGIDCVLTNNFLPVHKAIE